MFLCRGKLPHTLRFALRRLLFSSVSGEGSANTHRLTKRVQVPPYLLFQVVSDVSRYKEFVPFVTESFVNCRDEITNLPTQGGFRVGWRDYDEQFVCSLQCIQDQRIVSESITTLLFEYLRNEWEFKPVMSRVTKDVHTIADLTLRFKFKNPLYGTISSIFQDRVSQIMIEAFEKRAKALVDENSDNSAT